MTSSVDIQTLKLMPERPWPAGRAQTQHNPNLLLGTHQIKSGSGQSFFGQYELHENWLNYSEQKWEHFSEPKMVLSITEMEVLN